MMPKSGDVILEVGGLKVANTEEMRAKPSARPRRVANMPF